MHKMYVHDKESSIDIGLHNVTNTVLQGNGLGHSPPPLDFPVIHK